MKPKEISDPIFDSNFEKPFGYWVIKVIETDENKGIHAEGILCAANDQAEDVRARLVKGESFADLAKQYSQHSSKDNGGDLGWRLPGAEKGMLDRMIASLQPNTISDVLRDDSVKTKGGYWIVQVLDSQHDRPLDKAIREQLADKCLSAWLNDQAKDAKIENLLDKQQKDWAADRVIKNRGK
ncbi:MAG: peptidylprolyl isomerase [Chloroflexi bacterium]|nr:peptidylprolyl isomerase [Chloroflexota bacterium]